MNSEASWTPTRTGAQGPRTARGRRSGASGEGATPSLPHRGNATVPAMVRTESGCGKLLMWRTRDPALLLQEPHLHIREARHKALPLHQSLESESHLRFRVTLALVQDVKAKHPHDPHEGRQGGRRFREGCK